MPFFFRYRKLPIKRSYKKALRSKNYMNSWAKWYFFIKYFRRTTVLFPTITSWKWRSLYVNSKHYKKKEMIKKSLMLHLFWVLDLWKLRHPLNLIANSRNFPVTFNYETTESLEVYRLLHNWTYKYGLNKDKAFPYIITNAWSKYRPEQWMSRSYSYFIYWRHKYKKNFIKQSPLLTYLNRWFIDNRYYHRIQANFICKVPSNFPIKYTKTLWLRLFQYPCVYNYNWFSVLQQLSTYGLKNSLPWNILYQSKAVWTFDKKAVALENILTLMITQRLYITDYILFKYWRNLLREQDPLSKLLQIYIRSSPIFNMYRKRRVKKLLN